MVYKITECLLGKVSKEKKKRWMDLSIWAGWLGSARGQNPSNKKIAETASNNLKGDLRQPKISPEICKIP